MRYVRAKIEERRRGYLWENYIAEGVQAITNNIATITGGMAFKQRFSELLYDISPQKEETRTAEEIIEHMKNKLAGIGEEVE